MTKDFKKAQADNPFGQHGISWMLGGIAIGLLVGLAMYSLARQDSPKSSPASADDTTTLTAGTAASTDAPNASMQDTPGAGADERPGFSYHAVLPQLEVDVPLTVQEQTAPKTESKKESQDDRQQAKKTEQDKPAEVKVFAGANGFQIGSYQTPDQAGAVQKRLRGKGLNTRVEAANVKGQTWYRVRLGPATDAEMFKKWQQMLSGMGISPMAIRM